MTTDHKTPNIDLNPNDWEEVRYILRTHVPEHEVWAFGSRVSWTAKAYSDLDLAIITGQPLSLARLAALKEACDESTISIKVDLVDWATTNESFRKIIQDNKVIVQTAIPAKANWEFKKLIDCTSDGTLSYGIVQPGQHDPNGVPIVRVNNFDNGRLQLDEVLRVSPDIEKKYRRTRLAGGEVLLTLVGSTGQSAVVPKEKAGWNIARAVAVIRADSDIGADWINICLQSKDVQRFLDERANTTVQKTLNLADVREIPIPIPPKPVKEQIEAIFMALTNKIELNREINQTLEQIAQAIFKSWFVDFEPVKAKILAKQNGQDPERAAMCAISGKSEPGLDQLPPDQLAKLAATAGLFPDDMVDSDLGLIPKGWEAKTLKNLTDKIGSGATPRGGKEVYLEEGMAFIRSQNVYDSKFVLGGLARITDEAANQLRGVAVNREDVLLNITGASILRTCVVPHYVLPARVNQHVAIIRAKKDISPRYLHLHLLQNKTKDFLRGLNAGASREAITKGHIESVPILKPSLNLLAHFQLITASIYSAIDLMEVEIMTLAALRDTLLPRLLSGEIGIDFKIEAV